ncbi:50S ribosomal protein L9 [Martelella soudanensis]|uniref:50S ribosomal protein L9 n=1 Tax=unclassified Martelella TaxID=2629616 RepID=UPI0015DFF1E3|nr:MULTISPECIES: 50S ribosomal protein L9 [unclassified Martelella]
MDVILLERIAKLGQMGETVKVRDGYARNYLLPTGKALRANAANKARFEAERSVLEARNLERKNEAQTVADVLEGKSFIAVRAAGETGQLYGSVAARDVVEILGKEGFNVSRNQVVLNTPIKTVGVHPVQLQLHAEVEIAIELNVARTAEEAERQSKGEDLTSADAIYGIDEDALRPEDFFNPDADFDLDDDAEEATEAEASEEAGEDEDDK